MARETRLKTLCPECQESTLLYDPGDLNASPPERPIVICPECGWDATPPNTKHVGEWGSIEAEIAAIEAGGAP